MAGGLTPKQEAFVLAYVETGNASEAYRRAYNATKYKPEAVHVNASKLLADTKVSLRVAELMGKAAAKADVTAERIIGELAKIGFSDIRKAVKWSTTGEGSLVELIDSDAIDDDTAGAISEISQSDKGALKVKFHDKRASLVDLGKIVGLFKDGGDVRVPVTLVITDA